jgi:hypothetical protein
MCLINKAVLWVKGQGKSAHEIMLPLPHEIRLLCEAISSSHNDLVYMFWESVTDSLLGFGSRCGGNGTLA